MSIQNHSNEERQHMTKIGATLGETTTVTIDAMPAPLPKNGEPFFTTKSSAERGLTDSERTAAWALVEDINRFVVVGSDDEFYLEPRWVNANGFVYRMYDGHNGSTVYIVPQADLPLFQKAVDERRCNPFDAIGCEARWTGPLCTEAPFEQEAGGVTMKDVLKRGGLTDGETI